MTEDPQVQVALDAPIQNNKSAHSEPEPEIVFFFDIDNTLYPKQYKINELMQQRIRKYFVKHLGIDDESAEALQMQYYQDYGLAIEGLVRFNKVDAMEYNSEVDDTLPLDEILKPDPELRKLLLRIDRTKVKKLWLFTNAYINHAKRVVDILGVADLFDGVTFCDYREFPLICKPKRDMFRKAIRESGATDPSKCYFVDDSELNIEAARKMGWTHVAHYVEPEDDLPSPKLHLKQHPPQDEHIIIRYLSELPEVFPEIFMPEQ